MTWGAVGSTAVSVIGGSLLGGGSKAAERAAKDSAARAQYAQEQSKRMSQQALSPYLDTGANSTRKLAEMLGVADPTGYAPRPELQQFEDQLRAKHFKRAGQDYNRNSDVAGQTVKARQQYETALKNWEAGKEAYMAENPNSGGSGELLRNFTNADFEKDPGYDFRQQEGEKGVNRALAARGGFNSGAALKALDRYNQDYASNEFTNAFNRDAANKARTFSFLSGSSGQGLQAAGQGISANTNAANNSSQIESNLGNNLAGMYQANADNESNMWQNAIQNGLYAYERNKGTVSKTPDYGYTGGSSTQASKPWYLS